MARDIECRSCGGAADGTRVRGGVRGGIRGQAPCVTGQMVSLSTTALPVGSTAAFLYGEQERALWPLAGRASWPPPRMVLAVNATAQWINRRCEDCRTCCLRLVSLVDLPPGGELTVAESPFILGGGGLEPCYEVSFDGTARTIRGSRVAGAAAVLWGPPGPDGRVKLACAIIALPMGGNSLVAEVRGCQAAIETLLSCDASVRTARIVGDNPHVMRLGAGLGRLPRGEVEDTLTPLLARATMAGWRLRWAWVPRGSNDVADAAAAVGARRARALLEEGVRDAVGETQWYGMGVGIEPQVGGGGAMGD